MRKTKLEPQGVKIIVEELAKDYAETAGGITMVDSQLAYGKIVEISSQFKDVYKKGDTVVYPKGAGVNIPYLGKAHIVLNGEGHPMGDIWFIETDVDNE